MNKISDKEFETRLEDFRELIKGEIKPTKPGKDKLDTNDALINAYRLKGITDGRTA